MAEAVIEAPKIEKKVRRRKKEKVNFTVEYYRLKRRVALLEETLNSQQRSIQQKNAIIEEQQTRIDYYARDPVLANELDEKTTAAKQYRQWEKHNNYPPTLFSASSENSAAEKEVEHAQSSRRKRSRN